MVSLGINGRNLSNSLWVDFSLLHITFIQQQKILLLHFALQSHALGIVDHPILLKPLHP